MKLRGLALLTISLLPLLTAPPASAATTTYSAPLQAVVRELPVADENTSPYDRDLRFGDWIDADGDCQNTRQEVLASEGIGVAFSASGCTVIAGRWGSFYDNNTYTSPAQLQVDHMVPLSEAWDSGAQNWTQARRVAFANDLGVPYALNNIEASLNQARSDSGPEEWMPPANQCRYIGIWTALKHRWQLNVDPAEREALLRWADACPNRLLVVPLATATAPVVSRPTPPQVRVSVAPSRITRGQTAVASLRGVPSERLGLWAYTLPNRSYRLVRTGTANSVGLVSWTIRPGADTRLYGTAAGGARRSLSTVLQVRQPVRAAVPVPRPAPRPAGPAVPPRPADRDCGEFKTQAEAQAFYNRYFPYYGDFARLDGIDNDGRVCERLP